MWNLNNNHKQYLQFKIMIIIINIIGKCDI